MPHLYVIRHGETVHNAQSIIQGPRLDGDLSDAGWEQAHQLARAFGQTHLDEVLVSPMVRARQTVQPMLDGQPRSTQVVPELYEMDFGDLCGRRMDEVQEEVDQVIDAWNLGYLQHAFPGGESPRLVQLRVRGIVQRIQQTLQEKDMAVVAHGRINRILLASLLGWDLMRMAELPQHNANITHLRLDGGCLVPVRINDTSHLAS